MDEKVTAALIAAAVTLFGYLFTRWQTHIQVESKITELKQTQLKDVLAKRIEVYPRLWAIAQTQLSDLERAQRLKNPDWTPDADWANDLLSDLMTWHQQNGVFLSQASYLAFARLRNGTVDLVRTCEAEGQRRPTLAEFQHLDQIFYQGYDGNLPLATQLKNDLGSYETPALSVERGR